MEMTVRAQAENGAQRARIPRVGGKLTTPLDPRPLTFLDGDPTAPDPCVHPKLIDTRAAPA